MRALRGRTEGLRRAIDGGISASGARVAVCGSIVLGMGRLNYGARGLRIEIDDRLLAHIQALIVSKLRRREPFILGWVESPGAGSGRKAVWVNETLELTFEYAGSKPIPIDRDVLDDMVRRASSNSGLDLGDHAHNPGAAQKVTPVS